MTAEEFNALRPKPWTWTRNQTTFTLRDANGKSLGNFHPARQHETNLHEWMRHVGQGMSDVAAMICSPEAQP